jgi:hypothetical protein
MTNQIAEFRPFQPSSQQQNIIKIIYKKPTIQTELQPFVGEVSVNFCR